MLTSIAVLVFTLQGCKQVNKEVKETVINSQKPEYFLLRPKVEKEYGYTHAVKIGDDLRISGL